MQVHVVKMVALSVLVAAVAAQSAPAHGLTSAVPAPEHPAELVATAGLLTVPDGSTPTPVPDAWSFDDAHGAGMVKATAAVRTTVAPRRPASPRTPPTPPAGAAATGALPTAGTAQAVLAAAYVKAAAKVPRSCHLEVAHLAAIGQVESGSVGGRRIDGDHRVSPAIYGPLLDGGPFAVVRDSDRGAYDGASDYDRAVGPLQFLPGTWRWAGRDGDGDGRRDPQNVFDAALATADYLCRDGRDLSHAGDRRAAILSYNWSGEYVTAVSQWISFFTRHGLAPLDDVAFRVGSGGRASALAPAKTAQDKAAKKSAKASTASKKPTRATGVKPAKRSTPASTRTPTPTGTTTTTPAPSPTTVVPQPDPATPAPSPSAPTPAPAPSAPTPSGPSPSPTGPDPESTTTPPSA